MVSWPSSSYRLVHSETRALAFEDDRGGVMIDLLSGDFFQLNATATLIWRSLIEGASEVETVTMLVKKHSLPRATAEVWVSQSCLAENRLPEGPLDPYAIAGNEGSTATYLGRPILEIDHRKIAIVNRFAGSLDELRQHVWALSPYLLNLCGRRVFHAASSQLSNEEVILMGGPSGAGKTSLARAFSDAGIRLLGEDKVAIQLGENGHISAFLGTETVLKAWVAQLTASLVEGSGVNISDPFLAGARLPSETGRVARILILDRKRRVEGLSSLLTTPVGFPESVSAILQQSFRGPATRVLEQFELACALAAQARVEQVTVPDGTANLPEACRSYRQTTASN